MTCCLLYVFTVLSAVSFPSSCSFVVHLYFYFTCNFSFSSADNFDLYLNVFTCHLWSSGLMKRTLIAHIVPVFVQAAPKCFSLFPVLLCSSFERIAVLAWTGNIIKTSKNLPINCRSSLNHSVEHVFISCLHFAAKYEKKIRHGFGSALINFTSQQILQNVTINKLTMRLCQHYWNVVLTSGSLSYS